ncbi:MAG TPA: hypothetical protein VG015_08840, partial [Candidatus Dormibacteraeota bacterium]|nr:hypothetical protein [Candidatus Dormibacteraeota bacterium]
MAQNPLYIDADEEILEVVERLRTATATQLSLIVPHRSKLGQSRLNFQLLHRYAQQLGKQVSVVSAEPAVQQMAAEAGLAVDAAGAPAAQVVAVLPTPNLPPAPTTVAPPMPHSSPDLWVTAAGPGQNPALGAAVGSPPVPAPPPTPTGSAGGPSAAGPYTRQPDRTSESGPIASGLGRPRGAAVRPRPPSGLLPVPLRLSPRLIAIG